MHHFCKFYLNTRFNNVQTTTYMYVRIKAQTFAHAVIDLAPLVAAVCCEHADRWPAVERALDDLVELLLQLPLGQHVAVVAVHRHREDLQHVQYMMVHVE